MRYFTRPRLLKVSLFLLGALVSNQIEGFVPVALFRSVVSRRTTPPRSWAAAAASSSSSSSSPEEPQQERSSDPAVSPAAQTAPPAAPPVMLNGKRVLPFKILQAGLRGNDNEKIAAVYAVLNSSYNSRRSNKNNSAGDGDGWEATEYIGVSQDLAETLQRHLEAHGSQKVANVRALSFSFPQPNAMQEVAQQWRELARQAGAEIMPWTADALDYLYDDEDSDDDDDEDDEWEVDMMTAPASASSSLSQKTGSASAVEPPIVSPFESKNSNADSVSAAAAKGTLAFTSENVDKVLDEVRPYLISDGGNVSVERVDETEKNVYLKLEGACGSCAASTVTMQMGIERVLKENFPDLNQVLQVEDDDPESQPTELTLESVEAEVNRLQLAITAMGGVCEVVSVDPIDGVVELQFRGGNKVKQGLELAILDLPFVKQVKFVMGDD